jgi:hypothetical protein
VQARLATSLPDVRLESEVLVADAAAGIQEAIGQREAALAVMATHERGVGVVQALLGSVASDIVQSDGERTQSWKIGRHVTHGNKAAHEQADERSKLLAGRCVGAIERTCSRGCADPQWSCLMRAVHAAPWHMVPSAFASNVKEARTRATSPATPGNGGG